MTNIPLYLILSIIVLSVFYLSLQLSKFINKNHKELKNKPNYWLVLFIAGTSFIISVLIFGTNYSSLLIALASSTGGAFAEYNRLKKNK